MLCAYCIGNAAGPLMWKQKYKPRNHVPWAIIGVCYVIGPAILLVIRMRLARENIRRDSEPYDDAYDDVFVDQVGDDGRLTQRKVDKVSP